MEQKPPPAQPHEELPRSDNDWKNPEMQWKQKIATRYFCQSF